MTLTAEIEARIEALPASRRKIVEETLNTLAVGLVERTSETRELARASTAGRATVDAMSLLMTGDEGAVARVEEALANLGLSRISTTTGEASRDPEDLERWGRLKMLAFYRAIEEASFKVADLEEVGISRQRLAQLRAKDELLGIKLSFQRGFVYPRWQFGRGMKPKPYLPDLISAARREGLDAISLHGLMSNPEAGGGEPLYEACDRGRVDLALTAIGVSGELGG